jgi:hypothetical protein
MPKILFITGLPGSGKTTYLETHQKEFGNALICDDFYKSATTGPRKSLEFEGSAYFEDIQAALQEGRDIVIADILFCDPARLREAQEGMGRLLSKLNATTEVEFRFFENDRASCVRNIHNRSRPKRVEKELAFIEEFSDQYVIPEGSTVLPVYKA